MLLEEGRYFLDPNGIALSRCGHLRSALVRRLCMDRYHCLHGDYQGGHLSHNCLSSRKSAYHYYCSDCFHAANSNSTHLDSSYPFRLFPGYLNYYQSCLLSGIRKRTRLSRLHQSDRHLENGHYRSSCAFCCYGLRFR